MCVRACLQAVTAEPLIRIVVPDLDEGAAPALVDVSWPASALADAVRGLVDAAGAFDLM